MTKPRDSLPSLVTCPSCGAPAAPGAATCSYCNAALAWGPMAPMTPTRSVRDAMSAWGRSVFGAPRKLADLVTTVEVRDEVFERVFTQVVRRDVREERMPTNRHTNTRERIDPRSVDPFAISIEDLRNDSEHVTTCDGCTGSGLLACTACAASGRARCPQCGGSGQQLRQYKRSSRWVKCGVCRGGGTVTCGTCIGRGSVTCTYCAGGGHQLAWLTYEQTKRAWAAIEPASPVLLAHRQLKEHRALAPADVSAFGTVFSTEARAPLRPDMDGIDRNLLVAQLATVDSRLERVEYQQFLRLAVVRRDVTYEMCGTRGLLVLSGGNLVGSRTPAALRPIHLRLYLWSACAVLMLIITASGLGAFVLPGAYFARWNNWSRLAWWSLFVLGLVAIDAILREIRPSFKFGRLAMFEKTAAAGAVVAAIAGVVLGALSRPSVVEGQRELTRGDLNDARSVVDALKVTRGQTPDVLDLDDAVKIAGVNALKGDAKLKILDEVVARNGMHAGEAAAKARAERVDEIKQLLDGKKPTEALERMESWFAGKWRSDPELAELAARANDVAVAQCDDDACRYARARKANSVASTVDRAVHASETRTTLLGALSFAESPGETQLDRLTRLRSVMAAAEKAVAVGGDDTELLQTAKTAGEFARAERAKVPVLNADETTVAELLGPIEQGGRMPYVRFATADVFLNIDAQHKCRGAYVTGKTPQLHELDISSVTTKDLLSQIIGHPTTVHSATGDSATATWWDAGTVIVARWKRSKLVELRVGDATP